MGSILQSDEVHCSYWLWLHRVEWFMGWKLWYLYSCLIRNAFSCYIYIHRRTIVLLVEFRPKASHLSWNGDNCMSCFQQGHLMKLCSHLAMKTELRHLEQWRYEARAVVSQSGMLYDIQKHIVKQLQAPLHWYQFNFFFQKTLLCVTTVLCCFDLSAVGAFVTPTPKPFVTVSDSDMIA